MHLLLELLSLGPDGPGLCLEAGHLLGGFLCSFLQLTGPGGSLLCLLLSLCQLHTSGQNEAPGWSQTAISCTGFKTQDISRVLPLPDFP